MITHVLFDIDDTLFPTSKFAELARRNAINAMIKIGLPYKNPKKLYKQLQKIIKKSGSNYSGHFNILCEELKIEYASRYIAAAVAAYHNTKRKIAPYPYVVKILSNLKKQKYRLYVATNGNGVKQWDKLIRLRIDHYFEEVFVSEELGTDKSKEFYEKILIKFNTTATGKANVKTKVKTNVKANNCVMIGDKFDYDIKAAKAAGMHTIYIIRKPSLSISLSHGRKAGADFSTSSIFEIPGIIKKL